MNIVRKSAAVVAAAVMVFGVVSATAPNPANAMRDTGWGGCCNRVVHH